MGHRSIPPAFVALALALVAVVPGAVRAHEASPSAATPFVDPARFSPVIDHPYFPLANLRYKLLEGDFRDDESGETEHERVEEWILPETKMVAGVEVTVVEVKEYADGELTERTLDYYAQHEDGTVYYFGEDVDMYENGEVVSHEGAWLAGEDGIQPGVFLPAAPRVGQTFHQEQAPGIAEDTSTVIATDESITVPAGDFTGCIRTEDVNPLDGTTEQKVYCPGVGIVREEASDGALELISYEGALSATPMAASPSAG